MGKLGLDVRALLRGGILVSVHLRARLRLLRSGGIRRFRGRILGVEGGREGAGPRARVRGRRVCAVRMVRCCVGAVAARAALCVVRRVESPRGGRGGGAEAGGDLVGGGGPACVCSAAGERRRDGARSADGICAGGDVGGGRGIDGVKGHTVRRRRYGVCVLMRMGVVRLGGHGHGHRGWRSGESIEG